jgi:hypothetical protein
MPGCVFLVFWSRMRSVSVWATLEHHTSWSLLSVCNLVVYLPVFTYRDSMVAAVEATVFVDFQSAGTVA